MTSKLLDFNTLTRHHVPDETNEALMKLTKPHVESYNFFCNELLPKVIEGFESRVIFDNNGEHIYRISVTNIIFDKSRICETTDARVSEPRIFPTECRQRGITYSGAGSVEVHIEVFERIKYEDLQNQASRGHVGSMSVFGQKVYEVKEMRPLGQIPIMVRSMKCYLSKMTPKQLVRAGEEHTEMGGYFIINGNEKIVRLLVMPRRHYITVIRRPAFRNRGSAGVYTDIAAYIRCVRPDASFVTVYLHYLSDGTCNFRFSIRKKEYLVPAMLVMKALTDNSDRALYSLIESNNASGSSFVSERVEIMLHQAVQSGWTSQDRCLYFLGKKFKTILTNDETTDEHLSCIELGRLLISRFLFVHLSDLTEKRDLLVAMIQKVYGLASDACVPDNADSPMLHETLTGGHVYAMLFREKTNEWLDALAKTIKTPTAFATNNSSGYTGGKAETQPVVMGFDVYFKKLLARNPHELGKKLQNFLATGNMNSVTGMDLMQTTGFVIIADKLNFNRYLSHFRCIHRGAFFTEMKTTAVRKLLPESWGFLCPVHTPDGTPCGLLNHLAHACEITNHTYSALQLSSVKTTCFDLGMLSLSNSTLTRTSAEQTGSVLQGYISVFLEGVVIGKIHAAKAEQFCHHLRHIKNLAELIKTPGTSGITHRSFVIPQTLELGLVLPVRTGGLFPGVYLFCGFGRYTRPVTYLPLKKTEYIGSFEQVYMDIRCNPDDFCETTSTSPRVLHEEALPTNILSVVANMTPFTDYNQSPRNMYQCQMAKQTMGTPCHSYLQRGDNKLYRIQTPQAPIVRTKLYNTYDVDAYPTGTNAIVAVVSYTGYDMEDAMILNRMSVQRGFAQGSVYKTAIYDLKDYLRDDSSKDMYFGLADDFVERNPDVLDHFDRDGFIKVGLRVKKNDPVFFYVDPHQGTTKPLVYKDNEDAWVEEIKLLGENNGRTPCKRVSIKYRVNRNPTFGDKFSSRHGQKGVLSRMWQTQDLPFTESGMIPDLIINPNAFPSRMTIGMLIESMAGKAGAMAGLCHDATAFSYDEQNTAYDYFGKQLVACGYNYYGCERMYAGTTGAEMHVDIFMGVVYYQRLRHMIGDKYQVRISGPVDILTHQPVKGRKKMGGIRLGEMERDSLLAHGVSFALQDRLLNCSDKSYCLACKACGSIISPLSTRTKLPKQSLEAHTRNTCSSCNSTTTIVTIAIPYVLKYLINEMYAMNIKLSLNLN